MNSNHLIYVARPIDLGRIDSCLVDFAIGQLNKAELTAYDPKGAFHVAGRPTDVVSRVNEGAMQIATGAVAFLPEGVQSVGVPAEICYLLSHGTPVIVVTDLKETSWVVAGWAEHYIAEVVPLDEAGILSGIDLLRQLMMDRLANPDHCEQERVIFQPTHPDAILPTKGYDNDAGFDLYAIEDVVIPARGQGMVSCGIRVDIPDGMWAQITGRSSTLQKRNLMVAPTAGVIDEGYTGELFAPIVSISDSPVHIVKGERIAQLILHEAPGTRFQPMWGQVRSKARGANGFGSTGA